GDDLNVNANGVSTFATALDDGSAYNVSVLTQPTSPNQTCVVTGPMGNLAGGNVELAVACTTQYDIGVNVTGLAAGNSVVFQNNSGDDLTVMSNGSSTFATAMDEGTSYNVSVLTQPTSPNQTCNVTDPTGNINNDLLLTVECVTNTYFVGGTVSGLLKNSMVILQNNMQDNKIITCNGPFAFNTPLDDLSAYSVTVFSQPQSPIQECTLSQESGSISGDDVITVELDCDYTISGDYIFSNGFDGSPFCEPVN
uniref:hypothetical protein n=1 Tax=Marinicella rhabdoformis TaxID=2580566 RepID=UPI001C553E24